MRGGVPRRDGSVRGPAASSDELFGANAHQLGRSCQTRFAAIRAITTCAAAAAAGLAAALAFTATFVATIATAMAATPNATARLLPTAVLALRSAGYRCKLAS